MEIEPEILSCSFSIPKDALGNPNHGKNCAFYASVVIKGRRKQEVSHKCGNSGFSRKSGIPGKKKGN